MATDELDAEPGERLATPAHRRPAAVRAVPDVNRDAQQFLHPREGGVDLICRNRSLEDLRSPGKAEEGPAVPGVALQSFRPSWKDLDVLDQRRGAPSRTAAHDDAVAPDQQRAAFARWITPALEWYDVDACKSFCGIGRLDRALIAKLDA